MIDPAVLEERKGRARAWFETLRDRLCAAFEALEDAAPAALYGEEPPGRFERTAWSREAGGGGVMSMMRGRVFEKVGVHVSTVHGIFEPAFAKTVPGAEEDPRFFATGVSLIAHPKNPRAPTGHMNTRFIATTKSWFGGGGDLTPMLMVQRDQAAPDAVRFHAALKAACDAHDPAWHAKFKAWCDDYFFLPHRNEPRGSAASSTTTTTAATSSGTWPSPATSASPSWTPIRGSSAPAWPSRGATRSGRSRRCGAAAMWSSISSMTAAPCSGLRTGGNVESILSSLPPLVRWP